MMADDLSDISLIEAWLKDGRPFAFYRLPGEDTCRGIRQFGKQVQTFDRIASLDGRNGFVFVPFRPGKEHLLYLLAPDESVSLSFSPSPDIPPSPSPVEMPVRLPDVPSAEYAGTFSDFAAALTCGSMRKIVLSRRQVTARPENFSVARAFRIACLRYVHSCVYLFYTPDTGIWMGATPEILLSGQQGRYVTVALAGTQALAGGKIPDSWSDKDRQEQQFVTEYLVGLLRERSIEPQLNGPYTVTVGSLAHLKTEIRFELSDEETLGTLLENLHPTPAVCGLPKEMAYRFICDHEPFDRSYYSGFLGFLSPHERTDLYVNLRCMQITNNRIACFAGGGLLPSSVMTDEWLETEKKMQTMGYVIEKAIK